MRMFHATGPLGRCCTLAALTALLACDTDNRPKKQVALTPSRAALLENAGPEVCAQMGFDNVIMGTAGDDLLEGTDGRDCIVALGGNDEVWARYGEDLVLGGDGNDLIRGEAADDIILGGPGDDTLYGDAENDQVFGGSGNDTLFGDNGDDELFGEAGADVLRGEAGDNTLSGGDCHDVIEQPAKAIDGGEGWDACTGTACEQALESSTRCDSDAQCGAEQRCVVPTRTCVPRAQSTCDAPQLPTDPNAPVGKQIDFTAPPELDVAARYPRAEDGTYIVNALGGVELRFDPNKTSPDHTEHRCLAYLVECKVAPHALDDCFASVPTCTGERPWEQRETCCPASCYERYAASRRAGSSESGAFGAAVATCFDGLYEAAGRQP